MLRGGYSKDRNILLLLWFISLCSQLKRFCQNGRHLLRLGVEDLDEDDGGVTQLLTPDFLQDSGSRPGQTWI